MNVYFPICIIVMFSFGCQKTIKVDTPPVEKKTIAESPTQAQAAKKKAQIRYGITYPIGWTVEEGYKGTASMAMSDIRKATDSRATMNIAITETKLTTPKEVFDEAMKEYLSSIKNIEGALDRRLVLDTGVRVHEVTFLAEVNSRKMRFRILHTVKGGFAFVVTSASVVESFDHDNATFYEPAFQTFFVRNDSLGHDVKRQYYSIIYPEGWETSADINWADTSAMLPGGKIGNFRENMAVTFELAPSMDLKTYFEFSLKGVLSTAVNFKLISKLKKKLENGREVFELIYDQGKETVVRTKMTYALESGMGYIMLLAGKPETFETYETLFDKTVESFRPHRK